MLDLSGKTAVVTGAGRGIGKAIAGALYQQGAFVVFADINEDDALSAAAEFDSPGARTVSVTTDVADYDSVIRMKDLVIERTGSIDILVNNAGWDRIRPFMKTTPEFWDRVVSVNYR
ncbi:MAG: SDR family NAD(P)-dependent oxidoreductase, partial [Desulfosalsimonas sp.]